MLFPGEPLRLVFRFRRKSLPGYGLIADRGSRPKADGRSRSCVLEGNDPMGLRCWERGVRVLRHNL